MTRMSTIAHSLRRIVSRAPADRARTEAAEPGAELPVAISAVAPVDIAPNDPIIPFFQSAVGAVDIHALELESPALDDLRAAGVKLVVPLVTQGELIGLLNLGPRLSDQEYSGDDRRLLESLAAQAAPAVRVGQLVREQEAEIRSRERLDQELAVADRVVGRVRRAGGLDLEVGPDQPVEVCLDLAEACRRLTYQNEAHILYQAEEVLLRWLQYQRKEGQK